MDLLSLYWFLCHCQLALRGPRDNPFLVRVFGFGFFHVLVVEAELVFQFHDFALKGLHLTFHLRWLLLLHKF